MAAHLFLSQTACFLWAVWKSRRRWEMTKSCSCQHFFRGELPERGGEDPRQRDGLHRLRLQDQTIRHQRHRWFSLLKQMNLSNIHLLLTEQWTYSLEVASYRKEKMILTICIQHVRSQIVCFSCRRGHICICQHLCEEFLQDRWRKNGKCSINPTRKMLFKSALIYWVIQFHRC